MDGQLTQLLDAYSGESLMCHEAMTRANHHATVLDRYIELGIVPTGLVSDQRPSAIKDPPAWFYGDWEEIERKAAMEKTKLLAKYWKEEAVRQEGRDMKARYTRVNAIKAAKGISEETRRGLLGKLAIDDEAMVPQKGTVEAKQRATTQAYLKKLGRPPAAKGDGSRPGTSSVGAGVMPKPTYAQSVVGKDSRRGPAPKKETTSLPAKTSTLPHLAGKQTSSTNPTAPVTTTVTRPDVSVGYVATESIVQYNVGIVLNCTSSRQCLSGSCSAAAPEEREGDGRRDGQSQAREGRQPEETTTSSEMVGPIQTQTEGPGEGCRPLPPILFKEGGEVTLKMEYVVEYPPNCFVAGLPK